MILARILRFLVPAFLLATTGTLGAQSTIVYSSDFEADDGGFVPTICCGDTGTIWEHGVPTSGPGAAMSGQKLWATNLSGFPGTDPSNGIGLASPTIQTDVPGGQAVRISWWQYLEGDDHYVTVSATAIDDAGNYYSQQVFGNYASRRPAHAAYQGWNRLAVVLGPEFLTSSLTLGFRFSGRTVGLYFDDVEVEVFRSVDVFVEDFQNGDGEWEGDPAWEMGTTDHCLFAGLPEPGDIIWGSGLSACRYPDDANDVLYTPVLDLTPYRNRRAVYLTWNRSIFAELQSDGLYHEISYDGGVTWSHESAGYNSNARGPLLVGGGDPWVGFGLVIEDPEEVSTVQLRFTLTSDFIETEQGFWIDDFTISVPELVAGSGANPAGSLTLQSGSFTTGDVVELAIDDPADSFADGSLSFLLISLGPDPGLPAGTSVPGWNLSQPGAPGDLLVSLRGLVSSGLFGTAWQAGQPGVVTLPIPNSPGLLGLELWLQGALLELDGLTARSQAAISRIGVTNGLFERIGG